VFPTDKLTPAEAAVLETFVVPRYLSLFGDLMLDMLLPSESARIAHVGCRTGYPDRRILERIDGASVIGFDASFSALELARNKAAVMGAIPIEYHVMTELGHGVEAEIFSHAVCLHPIANDEARRELYRGMANLIYSGGQTLIAMPLRGSFQEVTDLFREYSLKHDDTLFSKTLEDALSTRPTIETLHEELEAAGLEDVDVEIRQTELTFDSGRAFIEDPVTRLFIIPELKTWLNVSDLARPLDYVRDAIDRYWSESKLELQLNVGCASARKP
jgi:trans-aconitate methyltransferase